MQMPVQTHSMGLGSTTPDFICKLYAMIRQHPQTISFSQDGTEVHIYDKEKFTTQILKKTFRHDKWRSFIRQMNMYNFRKVNRGMQTYIFVNNIFRQGNETNFHKIKRKINTREQQLYTQNNLEQDLKILLKLQSQSLGIANNNTLLHYDINKNQDSQEADSNDQVGDNRRIHKMNKEFNGGNRIQRPNSLNTIPSLTSTQNKILGSNTNYTNSLIYFLEKTIKHRKEGEQLCQEIKQNMEFIAKERKTVENKNILNTVKDSTQMIDEMANKFKQKIQNYVDYKISQLESNVQHFSNHFVNHPDQNLGAHQNNSNTPTPNAGINIDLLEYISGHSYQNIYDPIPRHYNGTTILQGINLGIQKQQKNSKLNNKKVNHSVIGSNYQSFSSNPIIPEPIQLVGNKNDHQGTMRADKKASNREQGSKNDKSSEKRMNGNVNVIISGKKIQQEEKEQENMNISSKGTVRNINSVGIVGNGNMNSIENVLGLTSLCSFSSINLDKQ